MDDKNALNGIFSTISNKVKTLAAIEYLRKKIDLPTSTFRDIKSSAHKQAFIIAGLAKMDILSDLHIQLNKSVENGESFSTFKKKFKESAGEWLPKEKTDDKKYMNWRAKVIWETNIAQAYHAGRWEDYTSPESVEDHPYLEFRHDYYGGTKEPRIQHKQWDGLIFPVGDPFWDNHFGMINYGCKCGVTRVAKWDSRVKDRSESSILSENRKAANYDEKRGEYPDNGSNSNFVNPGVFDGGGVVSLFEKIGKMRNNGGWQETLANETWDYVAQNNKVFSDNLDTWIDRIYAGKEVKSRETRSIAVLDRKKFEEIQREFIKEFTKKYRRDPNENILSSPVIFANGSQLSHAGRTQTGRTPIDKDDLYLLSQLNKAEFKIDLSRENLPTIDFFIKNKAGKTVEIVVKDFDKNTNKTKNSSIITFYYVGE